MLIIVLVAPTLLSPSGDLGIGLVWDNLSWPHPTDFLDRLLKSSSNWNQVYRCFQMISFWIFSRYSIVALLMFSKCSLDVLRMFAGFPRMFSGRSDGSFFTSMCSEIHYLYFFMKCIKQNTVFYPKKHFSCSKSSKGCVNRDKTRYRHKSRYRDKIACVC